MLRKTVVVVMLLLRSIGSTAELGDYVINADIGFFAPITAGGPTGSVLVSTSHFGLDHRDPSYGIAYANHETLLWIDVQVTQHAGSMSDRWLSHEVESDFRKYFGEAGKPFDIRIIGGNTIYVYGAAGWTYRWLSDNKVVEIEYHDSQMTKPEPLEVVEAYLAKHPSSLPALSLQQLRSPEYTETWVKDEMDRRLWLADKWLFENQNKGLELKTALKNMVDHINTFLDYRGKYFEIPAKDEEIFLMDALNRLDGTTIKSKLVEYKAWWESNKDKPINL